jgi:hypothetical protein
MFERSVHDNYVLSFRVNAQRHEVIFHTAFLEAQPHEYTDIVFEGVIAYDIFGDTFNTVISDLEEVPVEEILENDKPEQILGKRINWSEARNEENGDWVALLTAQGIRGFRLSSETGLNAWFLAQEVQVKPAEG